MLGLADGFLLYVRIDGALMAAYRSIPVLMTVGRAPPDSSTASRRAAGSRQQRSQPNGTLLYQRGGLASQLVRVDQHGDGSACCSTRRGCTPIRGSPPTAAASHSNRRRANSNEIWIADLAAQTAERLTREGFNDRP